MRMGPQPGGRGISRMAPRSIGERRTTAGTTRVFVNDTRSPGETSTMGGTKPQGSRRIDEPRLGSADVRTPSETRTRAGSGPGHGGAVPTPVGRVIRRGPPVADAAESAGGDAGHATPKCSSAATATETWSGPSPRPRYWSHLPDRVPLFILRGTADSKA